MDKREKITILIEKKKVKGVMILVLISTLLSYLTPLFFYKVPLQMLIKGLIIETPILLLLLLFTSISLLTIYFYLKQQKPSVVIIYTLFVGFLSIVILCLIVYLNIVSIKEGAFIP